MVEFSSQAGFGISEEMPYIINAGEATGAEVLDLGRPYAFLLLLCPLAPSGADDPTDTISIRLSSNVDGPLIPLHDDEGVAIAQEIGSTAFWRKYFVGAARRVQLVLSANATGEVLFHVIGVDAGMR